MRFLILGGTGRTGQLVIDEALERGHTVTALVRSPSSFPPRQGLTIVQGTPLKQADIEAALTATGPSDPVSAVISTLNSRRTSDSPFAAPSTDAPPRLMADSAANAIAAMSTSGVRKLVVMSSLGAGESIKNTPLMLRFMFAHTNMKYGAMDHDAVDEEVRKVEGQGNLDFVLVRPTRLVESEKCAVKVWPDDARGVGLMSTIPRASVASFIVDVAESDEYNGRAPVITS